MPLKKYIWRYLILIPGKYAALHHLGVLAYSEGDYQSALGHLQRAAALCPDNEQLFLNLGAVYKSVDQHAAALAVYAQYLANNPGSARIHKEMGDLYRSTGNINNAIISYRKAIDLKHDYIGALLELGGTYQSLKNHKYAIQCYLSVLQADPDCPVSADIYNNLGTIHEELEMFDEAVSSYRKAIQLDPQHVKAYTNLGHILKRQEKVDEAIDCFRRALQLQPSNWLGELQIASICPTVFNSCDEINQYRGNLLATLAKYSANNLKTDFATLANSGLYPPFGFVSRQR